MAFADYLKVLVSKNFDCDPEDKLGSRELLQKWGTDVIREIDPDFWVKIVSMTIDLLQDEFDVFILTDARFENELNHDVFDKKYPIYNVLVQRDNLSGLSNEELCHKSEQLADSNTDLFDCIIRNDGDLLDLEDLCWEYIRYFADWFRKENAA